MGSCTSFCLDSLCANVLWLAEGFRFVPRLWVLVGACETLYQWPSEALEGLGGASPPGTLQRATCSLHVGGLVSQPAAMAAQGGSDAIGRAVFSILRAMVNQPASARAAQSSVDAKTEHALKSILSQMKAASAKLDADCKSMLCASDLGAARTVLQRLSKLSGSLSKRKSVELGRGNVLHARDAALRAAAEPAQAVALG